MATATPASTNEARPPALERAETVAHLLDESIRLPIVGYRIGLDPILGVLPVAGDAVAALASLYVVFVGARLGVGARALATMLAMIGLDYAIGSVPVVGTVVDAVLKVNERNVAVVEAHVADRA